MEAMTGYHEKIVELSSQLVDHGWGELYIKVESLKDNGVKVQIRSGKHYVFFIKKNIRIDEKQIF